MLLLAQVWTEDLHLYPSAIGLLCTVRAIDLVINPTQLSPSYAPF